MPVIPWPDNPEVPVVDVSVEIATQRMLTEWFIDSDPFVIVLTPRVDGWGPGGSRIGIDGTPRGEQTFKLIPASSFVWPIPSGVDAAASGVQRKYDYTLLGKWDAVVEAKDYWVDSVTGQKYVVEAIQPYNGYEVRAMANGYGGQPDG